MNSRGRLGRAVRSIVAGATVIALSLAVPSAAVSALEPLTAAAERAPWTGGIDLYRPGAFSMQKTWLWCTAANVQIVRNIVSGEADHGRTAQQAYFDYMRLHNRYPIPVTDGVDPQGWAAGLRRFVDPSYEVVANASFTGALRAAVTSLRIANLPVGLLVARGNHAWILTGFTATADPASTTAFRVTSVSVVGPLYGLQSRNGYDMPPDSTITPAELARFLTPFRDPVRPMIWDGRFVTVNPGVRARTAAVPLAAGRDRPVGAASLAPRHAPTVPAVPTVAAAAVGMSARAATESPSSDPPPVGETAAAIAVIAAIAAIAAAALALVRRRAPGNERSEGRPGSIGPDRGPTGEARPTRLRP